MPARKVVFAAPILSENALRVVRAVSQMNDVHLGVITQDTEEKLPHDLRATVLQHWRLDDILDAEQLQWAVENVASRLGGVDTLFAAYEQLQVPLAQIRRKLAVPGMSPEAATNFRDKAKMKEVLRRHGLPCARFARVETPDDAWRFASENGYPLVFKPVEGAGARSTYRVDSAAQLRQILALLPPSPQASAILEEFIVGEEHSFEGVMVGGRLVWHSLTHYRPTPLEVLQHNWIQWCILLPRELDHPRYADIRQIAPRVLDALGMETGLCHMEWFRRRDGSIAISEVAARPPGAQIMDLISTTHEVDFDAAWVRLMIDGTFDPPHRRWAGGIAFLRGQGGGTVREVRGLEESGPRLDVEIVAARLPQRGQTAGGSYEGEGFVIVRHRETAVVEAALHTIISTVRVEMD